VNILFIEDSTDAGLVAIAKNNATRLKRRSAAVQCLQLLEVSDLADFAAMLSGEKSLED